MSRPAEIIYLYVIQHRGTGAAYVGMTVDPKRRWAHHCAYGYLGIGEAIRRAGTYSFRFSVVACCTSVIDACHTEAALIEQYRAMEPHGYNRMSGGHAGRVCGADARALLSEKRLGNRNARRSAVQQIDEEGKVVAEFTSIKQASELTGIHRTAINRIRKNPTYTAGGYRWAFAK